ncbi:hypothetical protein HA466_0247110 [Hirschfeldia incana]|nr:hypothetical protein HA466_0247110 [Hirschfeldia incana]
MAMEITTPAPAPIINMILSPAKTDTHKKNMIQVSNTKKPLVFYVNLAKRSTFCNTMRPSSLHSEWICATFSS